MNLVSQRKQRAAARAAADSAARVLALFEQERAADSRPRDAIEAARAWACGDIRAGLARHAAFAAHAAARQCTNASAQAAARAAGHAAATAHVQAHARVAVAYADKAAAREITRFRIGRTSVRREARS